MRVSAYRKLLSPEAQRELAAIANELIALDPMYRLASEAIDLATTHIWIDRRTKPIAPTRPDPPFVITKLRTWCRSCNGYLQGGEHFEGRRCGTCHGEETEGRP